MLNFSFMLKVLLWKYMCLNATSRSKSKSSSHKNFQTCPGSTKWQNLRSFELLPINEFKKGALINGSEVRFLISGGTWKKSTSTSKLHSNMSLQHQFDWWSFMSLSMKTELFVWRPNILNLYLKVTPMIWFPAGTQADELEDTSSSSSRPTRLLHLNGQGCDDTALQRAKKLFSNWGRWDFIVFSSVIFFLIIRKIKKN